MTYSYFIGLFGGFSLEMMQWIFLSIVVLLVMIGISAWMTYANKDAKQKTFVSLIYFLVWLFAGGIVGIVVAVLVHFITYAFISDFKKDYL